ncbi:MAG TPA: DUF2182 domain-containing protein [Gaiellaceae bacterium]|nr:DUF2182 domain-containing protein [Gaiellaceae bacterium]
MTKSISSFPEGGASPLSALRRSPVSVAALLLGATLVTWVIVVERMRGMDAGPGTDLGTIGWFVGSWVTMMAAMMLPSVAPMALLFAAVSRERARRGGEHVPTSIFLGGYLAVWTMYGLLAYGVYRALRAIDLHLLAWSHHGPLVAGSVLVATGVYQLTPFKRVCLRHCRSPLHYVLGGWRDGKAGAARMGIEHGAFCVGCCWGLMVVLFALGAMSLVWMGIVAGLIFAEKVLPFGHRLTRVIAVSLAAAGIWVAVAPDSVPGLTQPGSSPPAAGS